jgi:LemA protein
VRLCDTYAVQAYNTGIQQFSAALFATALNFTPHEFFNVGEDRKTVDQAQAVKL